MDRLWDALSERLHVAGWVDRADRVPSAYRSFTVDVGGGLLAVLSVLPTALSFPPQWPMAFETSIGVGFDPAYRLGAALTLRPDPMLIRSSSGRPEPIEWSGYDGTAAVVDALVVAALAAVSYAESFANAGELAAAIEARCVEEPDVHWARERFLVAAGRGRLAEAAAYLGDPELPLVGKALGAAGIAADERFLRQARRWLEAGGPPVPAVNVGVRLNPRAPGGFFWRDVLVKVDRINDAAIRLQRHVRHHRDDDVRTLREWLRADHLAHGIDNSATSRALTIDTLLRRRRLSGRVAVTRDGLAAVISLGKGLHSAVRDRPLPPTPEWLQPPEHAYPVVAGRSTAEVLLDPVVTPLLQRAGAEHPYRVADLVITEAWLTADDEHREQLAVHIGRLPASRVGVLSREDSAAFAWVLADCERLDEHPVVTASLLLLSEPVMDVRLPR